MDQYRPQLDWIESQQGTMLARLREWAEINSGSRNARGLTRMCEVLEQAFAPLGDTVEVIQLRPVQEIGDDGKSRELPLGPALRVVKRAVASRRVLLAGHMDTVFGEDHPFQAVRDIGGGRLNGPGRGGSERRSGGHAERPAGA